MRILFILIIFLASLGAQAGILKDFDSLGGNDVLIDRAQKLQPNKNVTVVQQRTVDRVWRNEFSLGYNNVIGGDAYLNTQMLGLDYHLHINPHWSVGLSYFQAYNELSKEGKYLIAVDELIPDVDEPRSGYEVVGNYSPIYGKINFLDLGVMQFDVYLLGTYGKLKLKSGETNTFSVGAGFGLWISQYLSTRLEIRQRYYTAQRFGGSADIETTQAGLSFGYLL